jgi:hypothetical protein
VKVVSKKAIDLQPGDRVERYEDRPAINLYRGVVKNVVVVDRGVQVNYEGSGFHVTAEHTPVQVEEG